MTIGGTERPSPPLGFLPQLLVHHSLKPKQLGLGMPHGGGVAVVVVAVAAGGGGGGSGSGGGNSVD